MVGDTNAIISIAIHVPIQSDATAALGSKPGPDVCGVDGTPAPTPVLRSLNFEESKVFHQLMTKNLSVLPNATTPTVCELYPTNSKGSPPLSEIVATNFMMGQPVKLSEAGFTVVRVALGADMVITGVRGLDNSEEGVLSNIFQQDIALVTKMAYLASNWLEITSPSTPTSRALETATVSVSGMKISGAKSHL